MGNEKKKMKSNPRVHIGFFLDLELLKEVEKNFSRNKTIRKIPIVIRLPEDFNKKKIALSFEEFNLLLCCAVKMGVVEEVVEEDDNTSVAFSKAMGELAKNYMVHKIIRRDKKWQKIG